MKSLSLFLEIPEWPFDLRVRSFNNSGEIIVEPHWHKEIELIYVTKGSVNIGFNDEIIPIHEGEIFVFESGVSHYFLASPESERLVCQFDLAIFRENLVNEIESKQLVKLFDEAENASLKWPYETVSKMRNCLLNIQEETTKKKQGFQYAIIGLLSDLLTMFFREIPKKEKKEQITTFAPSIKNKETLERLNQVFKYLEDHYGESITLDEVAKFVNFSPHYFTRFFKKNTGSTFIQFLTEYRINQAKYILAHEAIPMLEVAEKAGFNSVKTFHHVFKEQVGMSPMKYQKSMSFLSAK